MFRRLLSSSARAANGLTVAPVAESSVSFSRIPESMLPPVIQRHIARELANLPKGPVVRVSNPFLLHTAQQEVHSSRPDIHPDMKNTRTFIPPLISVRRQKKMLEEYPGELLPPSAENPIQAIPIELEDGTIVEWAGKWASKSPKSVYGKRRRMFKGTKAERDRAGRDQDRKERMGGMEKRIAEWKKTKAEEKLSTKSSLPF